MGALLLVWDMLWRLVQEAAAKAAAMCDFCSHTNALRSRQQSQQEASGRRMACITKSQGHAVHPMEESQQESGFLQSGQC